MLKIIYGVQGAHQDTLSVHISFSESLPNITGDLLNGYGVLGASHEPVSGAFTRANGANAVQMGSTFGCTGLSFDASRSSSIYKDNAHVKPLSCATMYLIKW